MRLYMYNALKYVLNGIITAARRLRFSWMELHIQLENMGIIGVTLDFIYFYVTNRTLGVEAIDKESGQIFAN